MRVQRFPEVATFWRDARDFLERDEMGNTQLLAIAGRHAVEPVEPAPDGYLIVDDGKSVAAALLTPKGTLFLSPATRVVLRVLHDALAAEGRAVIDVVAERETARTFADLTAAPHRTHVRLQLYRLDEVLPVDLAPGAMRQATRDDFELLCAWQSAFVRDANVREGADDVAGHVARRLESGGTWIWVLDGVPVSYAGFRATPINSARIAPVYTPAEHRGRGYATALVAQMSRHLLREGRRPLYLYADMTNPTANGVYRRIGFRPAGEHLHLTRDGG